MLSTRLQGHTGPSYCGTGKNCIYTAELCKSGRDWISGDFNKAYKRYTNLKLLMRVFSNVTSTFLTQLTFIGTLLVSFTIFTTSKLRKYMNLIMYLSAPLGSLVGLIVAISVTHMSDVPYKNSLDFQEFWKRRFLKKIGRKRLTTCIPIGVSLGPYGIATASLGLLICEDIFKNTATLLLMGII